MNGEVTEAEYDAEFGDVGPLARTNSAEVSEAEFDELFTPRAKTPAKTRA